MTTILTTSTTAQTDTDWIWDSPVFSVVAIAIFAIFALVIAWETFGQLVLRRIPDDAVGPDTTETQEP